MTTFQMPPGSASVAAAIAPTPAIEPQNPALDAAEQNTAGVEVVESAQLVRMYSCHPIMNLTIGGFQFEKGRLDLTDPAEIEKFEAELEWFAKHQPTTRAMVKTIDVNAASAFASQFRPDAVKGGSDTSTIRAGQALAAAIGSVPTPPAASHEDVGANSNQPG